MENAVIVTLYCTHRGTARQGDPAVIVYVYDGPVPLPDGYSVTLPSSVFELLCDRRIGGCGRSPRPSDM